MKASSSRQPLSIAAQILKLVGIILIASSLLDYIFLLIPPSRANNVDPAQWQLQWQQTVTGQIIDRGIIPMVGLGLLFTGFWIEGNSESIGGRGSNLIKLISLVLSALLGFAFLLPLPLLNFNSLRLLNNQTIERINQEASQVESAVQARSQQVNSLINDPQKLNQQLSQLDQVIKSGRAQGQQLSAQQLAQLQKLQQELQKFQQDPKALKQELASAQTKIKSEKLEAENRARNELVRIGVRNIISSLLLAIGYIGIGWMGLTSITGANRR